MYLCMYIVSFSIECIYWALRAVFFGQLLMRVRMWAFRHPPFLIPILLCILHVRDKWPFPRDSDHCLLHQSIHWWFGCSSWLGLSRSMLIHFPFIYLFFWWYMIRLAYIDLHSYWFTFYIRYFPHIFLIHPISNSIFFISSLSSLTYSSWILPSSPIYSYWTSSDPWFMRLFAHIAFYTRGYEVLSLCRPSILSSLHMSY